MLFSNIENLLPYPEEDYLESLENQSNYNPLDDSFSLHFSKDNQFKNPIEQSDVNLLNNSNNKNIEGDKECSPAPAPLRPSPNPNPNQNQNELSYSHNMECPEVVNKPSNNEELDENSLEMRKIFPYNDYTNNNNDEELIEKPFDINRYFLENENLSQSMYNIDYNNNDLENKSAALNVIPINDNLNSPPNKINNVNNENISNSDSNVQELSCPKNNFIITPYGSKNKQIYETILFFNTKEENKAKSKNRLVRKLKPDSLRKKIKARFHKKLRQIINNKLKVCGSKFLFDLLPQPFITNINIEFNRPLLNITMRELFQKTFGFKAKDREKINYNIQVIKYLEKNPHINNDEYISKFLDSTYEEIIQKYMHGKYLLEDIERLKKEGENIDYINRYTYIAKHWIDFYKNK